METQEVQSLVEDLGGNVDDLERALTPILKTALSASASKLPLLDKAKLYVLATYAIESVLFSVLRLNGVDAKSHPVFQELSRVKEYFAKIKSAETAGTKRSSAVDKAAAGRLIKHGLAGNERYDRKRATGGEKRKFENMSERVGSHIRFEEPAKKMRAQDGLGDAEPVRSEASSSAEQELLDKKAAKRQRRTEARLVKDSADTEDRSVNTTIGESDGVRPKAPNETSQALLRGPLPPAEDRKGKKKKRRNRGQAMQELENKRAEEMH